MTEDEGEIRYCGQLSFSALHTQLSTVPLFGKHMVSSDGRTFHVSPYGQALLHLSTLGMRACIICVLFFFFFKPKKGWRRRNLSQDWGE